MMNFSSQTGVIWCIADENYSDLRYSEVPPKRKNKALVKILGGGRQHRTTPAGQMLGGRDPCNPCGVDAYRADGVLSVSCGRRARVTQRAASLASCYGHRMTFSVTN